MTENNDQANTTDAAAQTVTETAAPAAADAASAPQAAEPAPAPVADASGVAPETVPEQPAENPAATANAQPLIDSNHMDLLSDVYITLTIEVGRSQIKIRDLLNLTKGSIIELNKLAGEPVDIYANGKLISSGSIITANGKYCVRLSSINHKLGAESDGK